MNTYKKHFWFFSLPALIPFFFVILVPSVMGVGYSFTDWRGAYVKDYWVGISNYTSVLQNQEFIDSFFLTIRFTLVCMILINLIGFLLALMLTSKIRHKNLFRTLFFVPNLVGGLILGYIWKFIFDVVFDDLLYSITDMEWFRFWLQTEEKAFWALVIVAIWQLSGYMMIIYIAGLESIPTEQLEAAKVEGATGIQTLFHVTIPAMSHTFTITLFLTLSYCFKYLDPNLALTNGRPGKSTELLALHILRTGQDYGKYGLAQAEAIIFFLLIGTAAMIQMYLLKRKEVES